jgi:hypothetical protein
MKMNEKLHKDTPLIPFSEFKEAAKKILSVSKEESDRQLEEFQESLQEKRDAKDKMHKAA